MTPINGFDELAAATARGMSIVFFHRPTCPICQDMKPVVEEAERALANGKVRFVSVNLDGWGNGYMERRFNIDGTPSLVWFIDGRPVYGLIGMRELEEIVRETERIEKR